MDTITVNPPRIRRRRYSRELKPKSSKLANNPARRSRPLQGAYKRDALCTRALADDSRALPARVRKGFLSANILLGLSRQGRHRHWLIPARSNLRWEVLSGSADDYRVRIKVSPQARQINPALPSYWDARALKTASDTGKCRTLLTPLLGESYPAAEWVERYNEHWHIEVSHCKLQQSLLSETLRCRAPVTMKQEIRGVLPAYNLVRLEMAEVTREAKVAPTARSFIRALHYLQHECCGFAITAQGKLPTHLQVMRKKLATLPPPQTHRGRECPPEW